MFILYSCKALYKINSYFHLYLNVGENISSIGGNIPYVNMQLIYWLPTSWNVLNPSKLHIQLLSKTGSYGTDHLISRGGGGAGIFPCNKLFFSLLLYNKLFFFKSKLQQVSFEKITH